MSRRIAITALLVTSLIASGVLAIETPKNGRGFNPDGLYHFGNVDSVNLFNGNVIVTLAIGQHYDVTSQFGYQLMLSYNSHIWDVYTNIYGTYDYCDPNDGVVTYAPNQFSNVGAGWSIGYGRLFPACSVVNDIFAASYESPDGGAHAFTATPPGAGAITPGYNGPVFTDDNSHMRLRNSDPNAAGPAYLDFPDGTTYTYAKRGCTEWPLQSMTDPFGNTVLVSWDSAYLTETLVDPYGRRTVIHYAVADTDASSIIVDSVDVPAFSADPTQEDATVSTYHFHYDYPRVAVPFAPGSPGCSNAYFTAPVLTSIDLPDQSKFVMTHNPADIAMQRLTLPTGGIISWNWTNWQIPGDTCKPANFFEGVVSRKFRDPFTGIEEQWSYDQIVDPGPYDNDGGYCSVFGVSSYPLQWPEEQQRTVVTSPKGDKTVHYFSIWRGTGGASTPLPFDLSPNGFDPDEFGLPFTHFEQRSGLDLFLSTREYDCKGVVCDDNHPDRSTYVKYEPHPWMPPYWVPGIAVQKIGDALPKTNRTYFETDTPAAGVVAYTETAQDDYDGYGHYRKVTTSGNFGPATVQSRIVTTNYNGTEPEVGTPPQIKAGSGTWAFGFVPYPENEPWILGTYTSITREEGNARSKQLFFFDRADGFLKRVRVRRGTDNGSGVFLDIGSDTHDLITAFEKTGQTYTFGRLIQPAGEVASETRYGGDVTPLASCTGTCDGQNALATFPLASGKTINRTYAYGTLATEQYLGGAFPTINATIERNTGAPVDFMDPAGHHRTMKYDGMSRISEEVLPGGLVMQYLYFNAGTSSRAAASVATFASNDLLTPLTQTTYQYDAFGRVVSVLQLMPDPSSPTGSLTHRDTVWNTLGQKLSETEPALAGSSGVVTSYTYDAFGRVTSVTPPDGPSHAVSNSYAGIRATTTTVGATVQGVPGGIGSDLVAGNVVEHPVSKTVESDSFGRLAKVTESSHAGAPTTATYNYDVLDHLAGVTMTAPEGTQSRAFTFDNRGFLVKESHPENGGTSYDRYDVFGHAVHTLQGAADGPFDLTYVYDIYQRLAEVRQGASGQTLVKQMTYDALPVGDPGAPYSENGQLVKSYRRNFHAELGGDVGVNSHLHYDSTGRLDQKTTAIGNGPSFTQHYSYDVLGEVTSLQYPTCSGCTPIGGGAAIPARQIDFRWSHGYLTGVDQGASHFTSTTAPITYWPNGMIKDITHVATDGSHPVTDSQTLDQGMSRPGTITFTGASSCNTQATVGAGGTAQNGSFDIPIVLTGTAPWALTWSDGATQSNIMSSPATRHVTPATTTSYSITSVSDAICTGASFGTAQVTVLKLTPTLTWHTPAPIVLGTPLSSAQLNATANVPGQFAYNPLPGTVLAAGNSNLTVTFSPTDSTTYNQATATVTLFVLQAGPVLTWLTPASIVYGTPLGATQLNATSTVPGVFTYSPAAGAILNAGTDALSVSFAPTDAADYTAASKTVTLLVQKAVPAIAWQTPANIDYGTPLGALQLNATSTVAGAFAYAPASGTILGVGTQTLSVSFAPTDPTNYTSGSRTVTLVVQQAAPVITWPTPANITYGTPLGAAQLNATSTVAGTFAYTPTAGTILGAGTQTLSVSFTPTDSTNYTSAIRTVTLVVQKAVPVITWTPAGTTYGTGLGASQLNASSNTAGFFTYTPVAGTILDPGTQTLSVSFAPSDTTNYTSTTASVTINVAKATQMISWNTPAAIVYGMVLGLSQLNATVTVPGPAPASALVYNPTYSYVPPSGDQTLTVTAPATANYNVATASVVLFVCGPPVITVQPTGSSIAAGQYATLSVAVAPRSQREIAMGGSPVQVQWYVVGGGSSGFGSTTIGSTISVRPYSTTTYYARIYDLPNSFCGVTQSNNVTVTLTNYDAPPVANFTVTCTGNVCNFNASGSSDDHGVASYLWYWGDGTPTSTGGPLISHTYANSLSYTIQLVVTDTIGQTGSITKSRPCTGRGCVTPP